MNEERLKVLKMLKEGRITMEEAELLLDALGDSESSQSSGDSGTASGEKSENTRRGESSERRHGFPGWGGIPEGLFNFDWKLDPKMFQTGFRDAMKGFEQSMRDFASEFKEKDFAGGFKDFFGRTSGQSTKPVRIETLGVSKVSLNNRWGDLRIRGADTNEVTGSATVTAWDSDSQAAEEKAEDIEVTHYREGDTIVIRCEAPEGARPLRFRTDFDITVPREYAIHIKGMSGDVAVSDLGSGVEIMNLSGDVIVQRTNGIMTIESKSGDIEILDCEGELRAHSLSGEIDLERLKSVMVQAHTVSGDVSAEVTPDGPAEIDLQSTSGDITLKVPEECGIAFTAETSSGEVSCKLPVQVDSKSAGRMSGSLNGGGATARLRTKSGDVVLKS